MLEKNKSEKRYSIIFDKFKYYLDQSIKRHLVSDRKIGLSLSGGNDSEVIADQIKKIFSKYTICYLWI